LTVIEKEREDVFEAASTALNTKFDVVLEPTALKPEIFALDTPFSCTVVIEAPAGSEPDCNSKVTFPADSGSNASTVKVVEPSNPFKTVPKEPDAVLNVGEASILI
jgi:hypothetical protein